MPNLDVNGLTLHFTEIGSGEVMVLVHGGNATGSFWRNLSDSLMDSYRLLAIDLYGCGGTDPWPDLGYPTHDDEARLVLALMEHCGGAVHLVGHSYGAGVSLRVALTHKAKLRSLTLIESTAYLLLKQAGDEKTYIEVCAWRDNFIQNARRGALDDAWVSIVDRYGGEGTWKTMSEKVRSRLRETTEMFIGGFHANSNNPTTLEECHHLQLPTLLIRGQRTVHPEGQMTEILAGHIPGCHYEVIKGAGHMSPQTHPREVGMVIKGYLQRISRKRGRWFQNDFSNR